MYPKLISITLLLIAITAAEIRAQDHYSPLVPPKPLALTTSAQQFRLGELVITGNTHTKMYVILRLIPISPGEIFNTSLWELGLEQINRSGLFEPIEQKDIVLKPNPATGLIDVELHLTERDRQRVDFSGGGGTTGGSSIAVDYANMNLSGRADRFIGRVRYGSRERAGGATYSAISYGRVPIYFDLSGFFERLEFVNARTITQEKSRCSSSGVAAAALACLYLSIARGLRYPHLLALDWSMRSVRQTLQIYCWRPQRECVRSSKEV